MTTQGHIRCGKIGPYRKREPDKKYPRFSGFENINVTARNRQRWRRLAPLMIGPFRVIERKVPMKWYPEGIHPGFTAVDERSQSITVGNLENYFASSKIYVCDLRQGIIQPAFFERRAVLCTGLKSVKKVLPKNLGTPVAHYWDGIVIDDLTSRIYYSRYYEHLVRLQPEYHELQEMIARGINLHLLEYEGCDIQVSEKIKQAYTDPKHPFSYSLVLGGMLMGIRPWVQGT